MEEGTTPTQDLLEEPDRDDLEWPSFDEDEEDPVPPEDANKELVGAEGSPGGEDSWGDEEEEEGKEEEEDDDKDDEEEEEALLYGKDYHTLFNPHDYLHAMYPVLGATGGDEKISISRIVLDWLQKKFNGGKLTGKCLLDVCSGPSIHSIISASKYFRCVYLTEYSNANRQVLRQWANHEDGAVDWGSYFAYVAEKEGETAHDIEDRVRRSIRDIVSCNLAKAQSFGFLEQIFPVDCVTSCFTLEAVASDDQSYVKLLKKLGRCLKQGGSLLLTGVIDQSSFNVGGQKFFCHEMNADFVKESLEGIGFVDIDIEVHDVEDANEDDVITGGYFLLSAVKAMD